MGLRIPKRRRREHKTDYRLRLSLLKSSLPRIVIRRTNRYFIVQVVTSVEAQDTVTVSATSKELISKGWDAQKMGSLKSIPAGYLTGLLLAKKVKKGSFIIDAGLSRTLSGSRVFSVVKGLIDGGLSIACNESVFPTEARLTGNHLSDELKQMIASVKEGL